MRNRHDRPTGPLADFYAVLQSRLGQGAIKYLPIGLASGPVISVTTPGGNTLEVSIEDDPPRGGILTIRDPMELGGQLPDPNWQLDADRVAFLLIGTTGGKSCRPATDEGAYQ